MNNSNYVVQHVEAQTNLLNFRQKDDLPIADYLKQFNILVRTAKRCGINFADEGNIKQAMKSTKSALGMTWQEICEELRDETIGTARAATLAGARSAILAEAEDGYLGMLFYVNSNDKKYAHYKQKCANSDNVFGLDIYPTSVHMAYYNLENYRFDKKIYQM